MSIKYQVQDRIKILAEVCHNISQFYEADIYLGIEFYLFVSHGGMKRHRVHV